MPDTTETPAATPQLTVYHFILTVQRENGMASTRADLLNLPAGATRTEALSFLKNTYFPNENVAILFFDLAPNQL